MSAIDETHDPARRSWVASANFPGTDFPIQNLPFAVFRSADGRQRVGVGIGDDILDVSAVASHMQGLAAQAAQACGQPALNALMALGPAARRALRAALSQGLDARQEGRLLAPALLPQSEVELCLPARIGGFTDFFASIDHATNAGRLFRPDAPLLPNYRYVPVAYNGRANSVRVEPGIRRPWGQVRAAGEDGPRFTPSQRLDYEVELGAYIGLASAPDVPLAMSRAWDHIFGFSLLNDWSARDIQTWEYQPLGRSGQELCHQCRPLGRHTGGAGAVSLRGAPAQPVGARAAAASARCGGPGGRRHRHRAGAAIAQRAHGRTRAAGPHLVPRQYPRSVLDICADAGSSHE